MQGSKYRKFLRREDFSTEPEGLDLFLYERTRVTFACELWGTRRWDGCTFFCMDYCDENPNIQTGYYRPLQKKCYLCIDKRVI